MLTRARVLGAAAIGVVAQFAVDTPSGSLGARDQITVVGTVYAIVLSLASLLAFLLVDRRRRLAGWMVALVLGGNIAVFLPALASDPVIAGMVVMWSFVLLARELLPPSTASSAVSPAAVRRVASSELETWLSRSGAAVRHLALTSLALSIAVVGYRLSGRGLALGMCLLLGYGALLLSLPYLRLLYRSGQRAVLLLVLPVASSLLAAGSPAAMLSLLGLALVIVVGLTLARQQTTIEIVRGFVEHPSGLIVGSFAATSLVGTALLTFPAAAARPGAISPLDALFTATSATCVTGLIVLDTPRDFSTFGQAVILALIQIGGLGMMTLSTFAALVLGGRLGLRGERALSEMLELKTGPTAYQITRFIVLATLATETVGAVGLAFGYASKGLGTADAIWRGVFHSVSAFCNAGFSLQSDSLVMLRESPLTLLLHAVLIVLGGLGFVVLAGAGERLLSPARRVRPLPVQARTVLAVSTVLLAGGTLLYAACEWQRSLGGLSVTDKVVNALFQSITLRTAGFNSVDFGDLHAATTLFMILFMFVGGAPGSTAGGIKVTTLAVLLAAIRSTLRPGERTTLFDREVPAAIVTRSLTIAVTSLAIVGGGLFLLLLFERQAFLPLLFEATSAFGTVGLSLGATTALGPAGKLTIIGMMFVGRTGPLTLALLLGTGRARRPGVRHPETRLMVG